MRTGYYDEARSVSQSSRVSHQFAPLVWIIGCLWPKRNYMILGSNVCVFLPVHIFIGSQQPDLPKHGQIFPLSNSEFEIGKSWTSSSPLLVTLNVEYGLCRIPFFTVQYLVVIRKVLDFPIMKSVTAYRLYPLCSSTVWITRA